MEMKQQQEEEEQSILDSTAVQQLISGKGRLVEVPYTASVADTLNAMLAHNILAVPVAAPPGQWIGAGGSMILESDKSTGTVRKQYIGIVSVLDILIHLAESLDDDAGIDSVLTTSTSTLIGHSLEGLSLWTIHPGSSVYEALEPLSKGIHRALIPMESQMEHITGLELAESSPGYRMLTQTDLVRFLREHSKDIKSVACRSIESLGAVQRSVFGVPANTPVSDAVRSMREASLTAMAIVEPDSETVPVLSPVRNKKLIGTFSASDLRGCSADVFKSLSFLSVLEFVKKAHLARKYGSGAILSPKTTDVENGSMNIITCHLNTPLGEVMNMVVDNRVHRVWVTDETGHLLGLVTLSDILRVVRTSFKPRGEHSFTS